MKFEIPFEKDVFIFQSKLKFNSAWKQNLKKNKNRLYWAIPSLIVGTYLLFFEKYIGFLFIGIAAHYLINYFDYYSLYKKNKKRFFGEIEKEALEQLELNDVSIWEFNEDYFRYKYYKYDAKINWNTFKWFRIIEDNLFIDLSKDNNTSYILAKQEVGSESFEIVVEFLKKKLADRSEKT